jgi:hypothetical protein
MSLINEALKKAQKQRTGESPSLSGLPGVGGEPAARIARRAKPVGFNSLLTRIGIGAGAVALLVIAGIFLARMLTSPPAAPAPAKPAVVAAAETVSKPADAAPAKPAEPGVANANKFLLPVAVTPTPAPVTPAPAAVENKPAVTAAVVPAAPAAPAKPAPAAKLEPKAITYIENIRVAGIRASGADSKVLMNDRVYRVGDTVEHELGLKLTGITSNSLSFEDERGAKYTRNF